MRTLLLLLLIATTLHAQWQLQDSHSTASFRGIHALGAGVAWASGTQGIVLRTTDDGTTWQPCTIPPEAEKLDFRGIQAFDANTAIVMSSGKGDLSRLYKTTDACKTWKLVFTNPDKEGFFDAIVWDTSGRQEREVAGLLIGDPVHSRFPIWGVILSPKNFYIYKYPSKPRAHKGESLFAASNSSIITFHGFLFGTGGKSGSRVVRQVAHGADELSWTTYPSSPVPIGTGADSSGIFSLAFKVTPPSQSRETPLSNVGVAVGGNYLKVEDGAFTAAFTTDASKHWLPAQTPPHGYRSSVAFVNSDVPAASTRTWITVGPNGTDLSTDDGKNWRPLKPSLKDGDPPDADQNWNALSLPFVVGPKGRIGRLRPTALLQK